MSTRHSTVLIKVCLKNDANHTFQSYKKYGNYIKNIKLSVKTWYTMDSLTVKEGFKGVS